MNRSGVEVAFGGVVAGGAGDFGFVEVDRVGRGAALREHEREVGAADIADRLDVQ